MRTRVVVQSRLSSSRLPGKALMTVGGMPLIELVARRASRSGFEVVVATSVESYDDRIAEHLQRVGISVVRGDLDDVLGRFIQATADLDDTDRVIRLTGDNPVGDAALVQEMLDEMAGTGHDYGRVDIDHTPEGLGVEAFSVGSLRRAAAEATDSYDREHVTPWIRRTLGEYLFVPKAAFGDPTIYRCTTDCLHDYDRVSRLFDGVADPVDVPWRDLMGKLDDMVQGYGTLAVDTGRARRLTSVILGVDRLEGAPGDVVRDCFASAVNRGISSVLLRLGQAPIVATGTLPGLRQRLTALIRLDDGAGHPEAPLERAFAHLGQRRAEVVLAAPTVSDDAWETLRGYHRDGVVAELGLSVGSPSEIPAEPRDGQTAILVNVAASDDLTGLRDAKDAGLLVVATIEDPAQTATVLGAGADAVVAVPASAADLEGALAAASN